MDEEILDALTKANAVDQESGLTIGRLMEITGKDRDMVVGRIRSMKRDQKVRVSNESHLADDGRHARPTGFALEIPSSAMNIARNEHKDLIHPPIIVWLGPELQERLEAKRIEKEKNELMKSLLERPNVTVETNNGQIAVGDGNKLEQQSSVQSLRDSVSSSPLIQNPATIEKNTIPKRPWLEYVYWAAAVVVALATVWALATGKK